MASVRQGGIGDLLQVVQAVQADVVLQQATVGYLPQGKTELEFLTGQVEFEEVVLPRCVVGPPDDVEAPAFPLSVEPGERAEWTRRCCRRGGRDWFSGCSRLFDWRQRIEGKLCGRFHDPPLNELEPQNSDSAVVLPQDPANAVPYGVQADKRPLAYTETLTAPFPNYGGTRQIDTQQSRAG